MHCRFPGCRRRAADAELDHITPWSDGGTTSEPNLAATCTHHHRLKTHAERWHVHAHPNGRLTWTTPTGTSTPPGHTTTTPNHPENTPPESPISRIGHDDSDPTRPRSDDSLS